MEHLEHLEISVLRQNQLGCHVLDGQTLDLNQLYPLGRLRQLRTIHIEFVHHKLNDFQLCQFLRAVDFESTERVCLFVEGFEFVLKRALFFSLKRYCAQNSEGLAQFQTLLCIVLRQIQHETQLHEFRLSQV